MRAPVSSRLFGLVFLSALAVRVILAVATRFDGLYGQDPYAYYDYAIQLRNALAAFQPPPPFFWPLGYPLPIALTMLAIGIRPLAGQAVSVIGGSLAAAFVALIVVEVTGRRGFGAFVGGLLAGLASQAMISSLSVMSDALGIGWATLSAWAMLRYVRTLDRKWLALSAFTLGGAVLTRWIFGFMAVPWGLAALLTWRAARLPFRTMLTSAGLAVLVGGAVVGSQFLFSIGREGASHTGDLEVVGWDPSNAFRSTIENSDGVFRYERPIGLYYALPVLHPAFVFPLLSPLLALGAWRLWRARRAQAVLLIAWPVVVYIFLAGIAWQNPRFTLALFPPLAALVGVGAEAAWEAWPDRRRRTVLLGWCALGLAGSLAWTIRDVRTFTARKQADLAAARWAEAQTPPGSTMLTFSLTETLRHYTLLETVELYNETPASLAQLVCSQPDVYALVDVANIDSQWIGKSPEINLSWLETRAGLRPLGQQANWTLFEVESGSCPAE